MKRFKFQYLFLGFFSVFTLLNHSAFAQDTVSTEFVLLYRNEFTFGLCVFVLFIASWLGMKLPIKNGEKDLPPGVKFITALLGGILAFIYCLYKDKSLTLLNPIWITVASIVLPVTILNLREKFNEYSKSIKLTGKGE